MLPCRRGQKGDGVGHATVLADVWHLVEEGEEAIVIALRDGVELVIVAACALQRKSERGHTQRAHSVHDILDAVFLVDDAALGVDDVVAAEARGDFLLQRRLRQQIARELLGEKTVVGQVGIE